MCSQLARLLRLRVPILNLRLQYTQDLSLRATCRTIRYGMRYFLAFLRTRNEIPHLFVISSSPRFGFRRGDLSFALPTYMRELGILRPHDAISLSQKWKAILPKKTKPTRKQERPRPAGMRMKSNSAELSLPCPTFGPFPALRCSSI